MRGPSIDGPVDLLINIKPMDQQFGSNRYIPWTELRSFE